MKKRKHQQPWLTPTGVEIPTLELRSISRTWSPAMWEAYLAWYETAQSEALFDLGIDQSISNDLTKSIFEKFNQEASQENRDLCEQTLASLPTPEAEVLRLYFLEGRTEVEIGFKLKRSQTGVSLIKNRALSRLKRGNSGDRMLAFQYMRGERSFAPTEEVAIWEKPFQYPLKEARAYDPNNHRDEIEQLKNSSIKYALLELSEKSQRILYLRYWCDLSVNLVAQLIGCGANTVEDIESASISKVKRSALAFETNYNHGGD